MGEIMGKQNTFYLVNAQKWLHLVPINWGLRLLGASSSGPQNQVGCQIVVFLQVSNAFKVYIIGKYLCSDGKPSEIDGVGQHFVNLFMMMSVEKHCGSQWWRLSWLRWLCQEYWLQKCRLGPTISENPHLLEAWHHRHSLKPPAVTFEELREIRLSSPASQIKSQICQT